MLKKNNIVLPKLILGNLLLSFFSYFGILFILLLLLLRNLKSLNIHCFLSRGFLGLFLRLLWLFFFIFAFYLIGYNNLAFGSFELIFLLHLCKIPGCILGRFIYFFFFFYFFGYFFFLLLPFICLYIFSESFQK